MCVGGLHLLCLFWAQRKIRLSFLCIRAPALLFIYFFKLENLVMPLGVDFWFCSDLCMLSSSRLFSTLCNTEPISQ